MEASILIQGVSVDFPIYENSHRSLKNRMIDITTGGRIAKGMSRYPVVTALDEVNLTVRHGERVALVGHNGSGKTTLLRVLSGVYAPTKGKFSITGRTASLLDVSMGLDPDATGFENIYLRGVMDGLMPSVIRSKVDEIGDFTGLGDYLNLPVRTYSSGMMLRLAFAISTNVEADILIMDEWLSVGDAEFTLKAKKRLDELVGQAAILVIATHDPSLVSRICTREVKLEHGRIVEDRAVLKDDVPEVSI
jgi:lipopolysaccharide transport system ATP-binding protein